MAGSLQRRRRSRLKFNTDKVACQLPWNQGYGLLQTVLVHNFMFLLILSPAWKSVSSCGKRVLNISVAWIPLFPGPGLSSQRHSCLNLLMFGLLHAHVISPLCKLHWWAPGYRSMCRWKIIKPCIAYRHTYLRDCLSPIVSVQPIRSSRIQFSSLKQCHLMSAKKKTYFSIKVPALWPRDVVLFFLDVLYDKVFFLVSSWGIGGGGALFDLL